MQGCLLCLVTDSLDALPLTLLFFVYGALLQLAFDSEGIALTSTMGFVKNPVSSHSSITNSSSSSITNSSSSSNSSWCTQGQDRGSSACRSFAWAREALRTAEAQQQLCSHSLRGCGAAAYARGSCKLLFCVAHALWHIWEHLRVRHSTERTP
jgi:hypothetical protein